MPGQGARVLPLELVPVLGHKQKAMFKSEQGPSFLWFVSRGINGPAASQHGCYPQQNFPLRTGISSMLESR